MMVIFFFFFFSSRRRHTRSLRDWSSDVCSSDLGGSGSYVGEINDAARKLFQHAHPAGLTAVIGAVSLLGSAWTLGILRLAACAVLVIFRRWQHLLAFAGSV